MGGGKVGSHLVFDGSNRRYLVAGRETWAGVETGYHEVWVLRRPFKLIRSFDKEQLLGRGGPRVCGTLDRGNFRPSLLGSNSKCE